MEEGIKIGQEQCAEYLEREVRELLSKPHIGDEENINDLLDKLEVCVSDEDNEMLKKCLRKLKCFRLFLIQI